MDWIFIIAINPWDMTTTNHTIQSLGNLTYHHEISIHADQIFFMNMTSIDHIV